MSSLPAGPSGMLPSIKQRSRRASHSLADLYTRSLSNLRPLKPVPSAPIGLPALTVVPDSESLLKHALPAHPSQKIADIHSLHRNSPISCNTPYAPPQPTRMEKPDITLHAHDAPFHTSANIPSHGSRHAQDHRRKRDALLLAPGVHRPSFPDNDIHADWRDLHSHCNSAILSADSAIQPRSSPAPQTRNPSVDSRRMHRYGTDFGLGIPSRVERSPYPSSAQNRACPFPSGRSSIFANSALTSSASGNSENSSTYEQYPLDFPLPPSLSHTLRRVRSTPGRNEDMASNSERSSWEEDLRDSFPVKDSLVALRHTTLPSIPACRRRENTRRLNDIVWNATCVDEDTTRAGRRSVDEQLRDLELEMLGEALLGLDLCTAGSKDASLDLQGANAENESDAIDDSSFILPHGQVDTRQPSCTRKRSLRSHSNPTPVNKTDPIPSRPILRLDVEARPSTPLLTIPSHLPCQAWKDAKRTPDTESMRYAQDAPGSRTVPRVRSLRFLTAPKPSPVNQPSPEPVKTKSRQRRWSFVRAQCPQSSDPPVEENIKRPMLTPTKRKTCPPLTSAYRGQETFSYEHHPALPHAERDPFASNFGMNKPIGLDVPFVHHSSRSVAARPPDSPVPELPKSFMDITPEQEVKGRGSTFAVRAERMKRLLARASSGVIQWGRHFSRKGGTS